MAHWMVSIRNRNKHKNIMIEKEGNETAIETYQKAKQLYLEITDKYPQYTVELISRHKAFPPKHTIKRGYVYCPYCRVDRLFQTDTYTGYKHCPVCGISDMDYYVRDYNNLWGKK